ncbi:hypothetical protein FHS86_003675 [Roseimarinus sediminis]
MASEPIAHWCTSHTTQHTGLVLGGSLMKANLHVILLKTDVATLLKPVNRDGSP